MISLGLFDQVFAYLHIVDVSADAYIRQADIGAPSYVFIATPTSALDQASDPRIGGDRISVGVDTE